MTIQYNVHPVIVYIRGDPRIVDDWMLGFEEPDSTPNLTVEYSRGVMIM